MPYLKEEDVDRVLSSADVVDIIQRYLPLKPSGSNFKACCPFHNEKTPSFMVSRVKQIYHCFGCGMGGNVFSFIMQYEKVSFPEAVRLLADILKISISEEYGASKTPKVDYGKINQAAAEFFQEQLLSEMGKPCRMFLQKRGIKEKSIRDFFIGFAPRSQGALLNFLQKKGYLAADIIKAGLAVERGEGTSGSSVQRIMDKFRGRAMFPVRNPAGKVIGFSGRTLNEEDIPKYLNTPETPVFRKREILFGFFEARKGIREKGYALLMEGHLDVILSHQFLVNNAVGVQGTSLTQEHVARLKNYTTKVIVCFDGDPAGIEATKKTLPLFLEYEMEAEAVSLPEGEDPASLLMKSGRDGLKKCVMQRKPLFNFKLDNLINNNNILIPEKKVAIIKDFFKDLSTVKNRILKDEYFKRLSTALHVDELSLRREFQDFRENQKNYSRHSIDEVDAKEEVYSPGEYELTRLLIHDKRYIGRLEEAQFDLRNIQSAVLKDICEFLLRNKDTMAGMHDMIAHMQDNSKAVHIISRLASENLSGDLDQIFRDCLQDICCRQIKRRQEELQSAIKHKEENGEDIQDLLSEFQMLIHEAKKKGYM